MKNKKGKLRLLIRNLIKEEMNEAVKPTDKASMYAGRAQLNLSKFLRNLKGVKEVYFDDVDLVASKKTEYPDKTTLAGALDQKKNYTVQDLIDAIKSMKEDAPYGKPDASKYWSVNDGKDYKEFFKAALQQFRVASPEELPEEKKKEFFDYVDANWKSAQEFDDLEETSSVGAMGGGEAFMTPNAFSKPGSDPKKKRALKNNSWTIVEQKIKNANKKHNRRKK